MKLCIAITVAAASAVVLAGCGTAAARTVPAVTGQSLDVAEDTLDAAGLGYEAVGGGAFGIVVRSHWTVCSQSPRGGATATTVTLRVARACPSGAVPDVEGMGLEDARDELEADGFAVVVRADDGGEIFVERLWTVCDQLPAPGKRGQSVRLDVAHDCWDYQS